MGSRNGRHSYCGMEDKRVRRDDEHKGRQKAAPPELPALGIHLLWLLLRGCVWPQFRKAHTLSKHAERVFSC